MYCLSFIISAVKFNTNDMISFILVLLVLVVFFATWAINRISVLRIRNTVRTTEEISTIMQRTLEISHNYVIRMNINEQKAFNLYGNLLPEDGLTYEGGYGIIHPEDHQTYRRFITSLVVGGLRNAECIFRWDISGEKHLGEWRYMREQGIAEFADKADKRPANLICTLTDITDKLVADNEEKKMTNKYRKMFEQSIVGLAFYDSEGHLLTANQKLREILNFQSEDDPFYYESTLYNMPTFRQVIEREIESEYYFCSHSIIPERNVHCYTELRLHPIYDVNGQLQYITLAIRDVTQERMLYLQNRQNDIRIRQANEAIQDYENELQYLMDTCDMRFFRISLANRTCTFYKQMNTPEVTYSIDEIISHFIDSPFKEGLRNFEDYFNVPRTDLTHMYSFFHESEELSWNYIDSVPSFDSEGHLVGTYGIVRNVTPLIEKQEQLKRETERANQSGMMKSTFMANMTHEIRTPLNAIVGFSDVLPMLSTPEEKKEIIHVIMNNCDMLLRLINDMLAVSELDESGISIQPADTDFAQDFNDICTTLAQRVQLPNVAFIKENPYTTLKTRLDRERINQIITNFVTNAIKYTQQGHIKVGYEYREDDGGGLYIYCEDTGTGIKPEDQSKIFDRFVKLNDYVQGTGLGLNISKAIAEGCHGRIGINSEGEGKGSTFWVWIPCQRK